MNAQLALDDEWIGPVLFPGWLALIVRAYLLRPQGYTVMGGRSVRWISPLDLQGLRHSQHLSTAERGPAVQDVQL
jgi:hypothetical protein